ncbi:PIN domain-containing protein [Candidatus Bathyarchaeota archaeon]|nr:PIN domain-containing protein [Candidatus Bathyarchaeota archaeon]
MKICVDTLPLLRVYRQEPNFEKHLIELRKIERGENEGILPVSVISEIYIGAFKKLGEKRAENAVEWLLSLPLEIVFINVSIAYEAGKLKSKYRCFLGDALIAATALIENADAIMTSDPELKKISEVKVLDPEHMPQL